VFRAELLSRVTCASRPSRRLTLLVISAAWFTLGTQTVIAAEEPDRTTLLPAAGLREDAAILKRTLLELHPGLNRYLSPRQFEQEYAVLTREFARDRTLADAYLAFTRFTASIRCGHTYPNFWNQPDAIRSALIDPTRRLPFEFVWLDERMIVTRDLTESQQIPAGSQVLRIDGTATRKILRRLLPLVRADGGNAGKRVALLQVSGEARYEAFNVYYPLVFGLSQDDLRLDTQPPTGTPRQIRTHWLGSSVSSNDSDKDQREQKFEWKVLDGGIALLRMPTWAMYDDTWDWRTWLNERFDALAAATSPALIIDLRGNEGGDDDVGAAILARLSVDPGALEAGQQLVRYRKVPDDLRGFLGTWDRSFFDWSDRAAVMNSPLASAPLVPYYLLTQRRAEAATAPGPTRPVYQGRVAVLVDANNSSATFMFARAIHAQARGILVGQPTGGNLRGTNGGALFFLNLPNSRIEVDIPLIGYFPSQPAPDNGLDPDVWVRRLPADIAAGKDPELAAALAAVSSTHH